MSKKNQQKQGGDLLENPEVLAEQLSKTEEFFDKNKTAVYVVVTLIAVAVAAIIGYQYYATTQDELAQVDMFQAVYYFEADSLDKALNGDGNNYGFLEIIDEYSITKSANLAQFYAGATYLKQGDYNSALDHLKKFKGGDLLVQPRAYALMGDANMELGNYADASKDYQKAANENANKEFSPVYLKKAAIAFEKNNDLQSALDCYQTIVDEFPEADIAIIQDAKKHIARISVGLNS